MADKSKPHAGHSLLRLRLSLGCNSGSLDKARVVSSLKLTWMQLLKLFRGDRRYLFSESTIAYSRIAELLLVMMLESGFLAVNYDTWIL